MKTSEYKKYDGPVPSMKEAPHPNRRRCSAYFSGHWRCELTENHVGEHVNQAVIDAGMPFQSRNTGEWLVSK